MREGRKLNVCLYIYIYIYILYIFISGVKISVLTWEIIFFRLTR